MGKRVAIDAVRGGFAIHAVDYLGEAFQAYRDACSGARYEPKTRASVVGDTSVLIGILSRLAQAGFVPVLDDAARNAVTAGVNAINARVDAVDKRMDAMDLALRQKGLFLYGFQRTGARWLASRGSALLADQMGLGKAQPLSAKVLTPDGFVSIGSLRVGDKIVDVRGNAARVTGVFPQGMKKVFRVVMSDGASTECCDEHLWHVNSPMRKFEGYSGRVLPLAEIRKSLHLSAKTNLRHFVPVASAVDCFPKRDVPVEPYLLGLLLGDGSFRSACNYTSADEELLEAIRSSLPASMMLKRASKNGQYDYRIVKSSGPRSAGNPLTVAIRELQLWGKLSQDKFVPDIYKVNSKSVRLAVLQGLIDTDGYVSKDGLVQFSSASKQLAEDVTFLVRSLGGVTRNAVKKTPKLDAHVVTISLPNEILPARLSRKVARLKERTKYFPGRAIAKVEEAGEKECVCISVDSPDHLYITDEFIVTHNTVEALASLPEATEVGVIVICPATLKRNWLDEIQRWRPDYRVTVLSGKGSFRWPEKGEIVVINYDVLPMAAMIAPLGSKFSEPKFASVKVVGGEKIKVEDDTLSKAFPRDYPVRLVLDEAHFAKSGKAQRTVACRAISALCSATLVMTATPLLSRPQELYSVLQLGNLAQEAFGNFETFKRLFGGVHEQVSQFKSVLVWKGVTDAQEVGQRLSRVMLRRLRAEVLPDLPTKTYREIKVDLAPRANKLADKVVRDLAEEGIDVMAVQDIAELPFERFSEVRSALAAAKTEALVELIESYEEEEEPVIVFCAHHAPLDELGKRPGWGVIHGGTPQELRQDLVKAFQAGQLKGLACGIKAAGVGITLTRAAHAVFVDRAWTPADNDQAEDRICRIGQTRGCVITRLVAAHGLDKHIAFLIEAKMRLNEASVEQGRAIEKEILAASVDVDALIAAADAENARIEEEARVQRIHAEGGRILPNGVVLRRPRSPIETWAGNGLGILLGQSAFTPATVRTGCELARQISENNGLLTDQQWQTAVQICRVHHQQLPFGM